MATAANPVLSHWKWYDGTTGTTVNDTTQFAAEDTTYEFSSGDTAHFRAKIGNTGDMAAVDAWTLQYDTDSGFGSPTTITTSSSDWQVAAGTGTDGDACTERLTTTARTYTNGEYDEADGSIDINVNGGEDGEMVWCISPQSAAAGNTYYFRVLYGAAAVSLEGSPGTPTASVAASGSPEIPVGAGSLTLSGSAPTLSFGNLRDVPNGSLALAGYTPSLDLTIIDVPVGSLSLSGSAPTKLDTGVPVASGELRIIIERGLRLAGHTPTINVAAGGDVTRDPGVGSLTLSGSAPSLSFGALIDVPVGSLTITGYVPTPQEDHIVAELVGALTLAGTSPSLLTNYIRGPPVGSLTLTGLTPSAEEDHIVPTPVGSLTLSGSAPNPAIGFNIEVPVGSLTLAGSAPSAEEDHIIPVGAGSLSLTGYAPSLLEAGDAVVEPPAGSLRIIIERGLRLAGHTPTISVTETDILTPGAGSLDITGYAPSAVRTKTVYPDAGSLRIVIDRGLRFYGYSPVVNPTKVIPVGAGSLSLTGQAPKSDRPVPDAGTLTLTGSAPAAITPTSGVGPKIPVPVGSLTLESEYTDHGELNLTGYAPSLGDTIIEVGLGSLTFTGYDVEVTSQDASQPPAGSLTITGQLPVTQVENPTKITIPEFGSLSLQGYAPVVPAQFLDVDAGTLTLSGSVPGLGYALTIPVGSLTLSGSAPDPNSPDIRRVPAGSLTITGSVPASFPQGTVPTGSITFTGYAPTAHTRSAEQNVYFVGAMSDDVYVDAGRIDLQTIVFTQGGMSDIVYVQGAVSGNEVYIRTKIGSATLYLQGEI